MHAVGDIHGRADLLRPIFKIIDSDLAKASPKEAIEVYLGDFVDRGPDSRGVLDLLIERGNTRRVVCLKGNHEAMMLEVLDHPEKFQEWRHYGALTTLLSYGVTPSLNPSGAELKELIASFARAVPQAHIDFLQSLPCFFSCGDFFFVHAGVRPEVPLSRQREEDMMWIREEFLESEQHFGKYIVHGHTPVGEVDIRPNRINIDTGAYATGNLTLLTIQGDSILPL